MLLEEQDDESENEYSQIQAIEPPIEQATADTYCDSDFSDNEVTCNPNYLPRRILLTKVLSNEMKLEPPENSQETKKRCKEKIVWHKNSKRV